MSEGTRRHAIKRSSTPRRKGVFVSRTFFIRAETTSTPVILVMYILLPDFGSVTWQTQVEPGSTA